MVDYNKDLEKMTDEELRAYERELQEMDSQFGYGAIIGLPLVGYQCVRAIGRIYDEKKRRAAQR